MFLYFTPFALQGIAMMFDEFYFHRRRGLPLWEKIGHPLDTLSVLICYVFARVITPAPININIYIGLCSFSCLLITKDEFLHAEVCSPMEIWIHSLLFILHPVAFFSAGFIWVQNLGLHFLTVQIVALIGFLIYQITYWSINGTNKQRHI